MELKYAWELASERIIAKRPRYNQPTTPPKKTWEFLNIPEFDNKEDKAIDVGGDYSDKKQYAEPTKLIEDAEEERKKMEKKQEKINAIRIQEPETIHVEDCLECYWCGSSMNMSGFSKMNRSFIFGLSNRNVKVKVRDESDAIWVKGETLKQLKLLENTIVSDDAIKIYSMTVPSSVTHNGKKIAYTMMESSSLHKDYCSKLNLMDEIWVPSKFGKQLLQKSNIYPPVYVMPLGVDTDRYKPDCGTINLGSSLRGFKFLCLAKYSHRKGFDILLKAYMEEFSGDEDISLLLVTSPLEVDAGRKGNEIILDDFNNIKESVHKQESDLPHIGLYTKPVAEKDMPKVYNSCNAYICISRGEGFNMVYMEAGAVGLPVIASNVTAQTDYLNKDNSYLVEPEGYIEAKSNGNLSRMAKLCHFYEGQMFPDFGQTSIEQTRQHMRQVFENYSEAKEKAEKLRKLITNNYTWDMAINKVHTRLKEIK